MCDCKTLSEANKERHLEANTAIFAPNAQIEAMLARDEKALGIARVRGALPGRRASLPGGGGGGKGGGGSAGGAGGARKSEGAPGGGTLTRGAHSVSIGGGKTTFSRNGGTPEWWNPSTLNPDSHLHPKTLNLKFST